MNPLLFHVVDLLAKSAGIVLLAFATLSLWRSASAAQRCAVWLAAFFVLLLLPVTLLWQPQWSIALMPSVREVPLPALNGAITQSASNLTVQAAQPETQRWLPSLSMAQWLALVWLTGLVCLLAHRMVGSLQLRRLRSQSHPVQDERTLALTARVAADLGVERGISLRMASSVSVPLTWGWIKPVLLLPTEALAWDEAHLEAALRHEMGHIRHCDAMTRLITCFITAAYWPNVFVWLAAKAWRTVQEQAADDLVIRSGAVAENYALQLLEAARSVQAAGGLRAPAMAMAQPSTLETRLSAIMDDSRNRSSYSMRGALTGLATAFAVLVLCATAQLRGADEKTAQATTHSSKLRDKAREIILTKVKFSDTTLLQAVEYLQAKSIELDPEHKGLNLVIEKPDYEKGPRITLDLTNIPLYEALSYVASLSNRVVRYEALATVIAPMPAPGEMVTRSYKLPAGAAAKVDNARKWLDGKGVVFEGAASAALVANGTQLVVKNTQAQQRVVEDLISTLVAGDAGGPPGTAVPAAPAAPKSPLIVKAESIVIPTVQFRSATVPEALEFLRAKAREFDPDKKGVSILIRESDVPPNVNISLDLKTVPLTDALRYTAELAGLEVTAESYAFILKPKTAK
ncbi:MAG: M56 family metallopeptidase [Prosthecobacter sp.]|uniref:M56 family metallopeptidase n=1 Tax=Prosthecobacter sp. TaxID=1965333 RepID=UPI003BB0FB6D